METLVIFYCHENNRIKKILPRKFVIKTSTKKKNVEKWGKNNLTLKRKP